MAQLCGVLFNLGRTMYLQYLLIFSDMSFDSLKRHTSAFKAASANFEALAGVLSFGVDDKEEIYRQSTWLGPDPLSNMGPLDVVCPMYFIASFCTWGYNKYLLKGNFIKPPAESNSNTRKSFGGAMIALKRTI